MASFTCRLVRGKRAIRWPFRSNRRMCRLSCGIAMMPPFDTEILLTAESRRIVVKADLIFRSSHTLTVLSSEPDTTLSSLVNTVDVTLLQICAKKVRLSHHSSNCIERMNVCILTLYDLETPTQRVFDLESPTIEMLSLAMRSPLIFVFDVS